MFPQGRYPKPVLSTSERKEAIHAPRALLLFSCGLLLYTPSALKSKSPARALKCRAALSSFATSVTDHRIDLGPRRGGAILNICPRKRRRFSTLVNKDQYRPILFSLPHRAGCSERTSLSTTPVGDLFQQFWRAIELRSFSGNPKNREGTGGRFATRPQIKHARRTKEVHHTKKKDKLQNKPTSHHPPPSPRFLSRFLSPSPSNGSSNGAGGFPFPLPKRRHRQQPQVLRCTISRA